MRHFFKRVNIRKFLPATIVGLVLVGLGILWFDGAQQPYIQNNFSYSADTLQQDSAYDPTNQRFTGAHYAQGEFSYEIVPDANLTGATRTINNTLRINSIDHKPISTVTRQQKVDAASGTHVQNANQTYVFAPRDLQKKQSFNYSHLTYKPPARMDWAGEETLFGLRVYRYETRYADAGRIEQTAGAPKEGVGANQGLEYKPYIQLWVEPVSGWLVKYQEDTEVNLFDRSTNKVVRPYSHMAARFSEESIRQHADYAQSLKFRLAFAQQIAPSALLIVVLGTGLFFALRMLKIKSVSIYGVAGGGIVLATVTLVGWAFGITPLITLFVGQNGMNPLTAASFCLVIISLVMLYHQLQRQLALIVITLVGLAAFLAVIADTNLLAFRIDLLLFGESVTKLSQTTPSHMSLFTAFTMVILVVGALKIALTRNYIAVQFSRFAGGIVTTLGVTGLIVQFFQLNSVLPLSFFYSISIGDTLLFIITGYMLLRAGRHISGVSTSFIEAVRNMGWPALAALPLVIIGVFAQLQQNVLEQRITANLDERISSVENSFTNRVNIYKNTLIGASAFFASSQEVTRQEWRAYLETQDVFKQYPGVENLGFAKALKPGQANQFIAATRSSDFPGFTIFPTSTNITQTPILYVEPTNDATKKLIGYDLSTDLVRKEALERARDTNGPSLSNKVSDATSNEPSLLLVAPVYQHGQKVTNQEERRAALNGYVFSSINVDNLVRAALSDQGGSGIDFAVYDGIDPQSTALLYSHRQSLGLADGYIPRLSKTKTIYVAGRPWTLVFKVPPDFRLKNVDESMPLNILIGGSLCYFFVLGTLYVLLVSRRQTQRVNYSLAASATTLMDQVNDYFHEAELERGRHGVSPKPIKVAEVIRHIESYMAVAIAEKQLRYTSRIARGLPDAHLDASVLKLVLQNLLSNAVKYTPDNGAITLEVRLAEANDMPLALAKPPKKALYISLGDTGYGMPPTLQKNIFSKSFREQSHLTSQQEGTGLGLYIVKEVMLKLGGEVWFTSKEDHGTTFYLIFPFK